MWPHRTTNNGTGLALHAAAVALALLSALLVVHTGPLLPSPVLLAVPAVIVGLLVVAKYGAVVVLAGMIVLPLTGLNPALMSFGGAEIRASDVLFPVVVLAVVALGRGRGLARRVTGPLVGFSAAVIGSAVLVSRSDPAIFSALRFAATMSLALLVVALCRDGRDVIFLLRATGIAIMVGIGVALAVGDAASALTERFGQGLLGPNILGLVSAFLVLLGSTRAVFRNQYVRLLLALSGAGGLVLAKSVGSALALITALALLYGLRNRDVRAGRGLVAFTVLFAVAVAFVAALRPTSLPWNEDFSINSGQQRLIQAYAGVHVFLQHPLVGVGWGQSGEAIRSPSVGHSVREVFPSANPLLYPDVQTTGVHNAYIQALAELGLTGALMLLWMISSCFRVSAATVRAGHPLAPLLAGSLMLFAIWWNETGLFGGQPETFLFAVVLGSVAVARSELREKLPASGADWHPPPGSQGLRSALT